jgi:hypothetical protein
MEAQARKGGVRGGKFYPKEDQEKETLSLRVQFTGIAIETI